MTEWWAMIGAVAGRAERTLSEAELLRQYPVLQAGLAALFLLGLTADAWLLARWGRRGRRAGQVGPKPWGLHDLLLVTGALILTLLTGMGVLALAIRRADGPWFLAGDCLVRVGFVIGLLGFVRRRQATLDWDWAHAGRATGQGIIAFLAVLPPLAMVAAGLTALFEWLQITPAPQPVALLFVETDSRVELALLVALALVIAPVFEEIFFRGFAYPALKHRFGPGLALLLVSTVFAAIHVHLESAVPLFVLAVGLTLAYEWSGSLVAPVVMHAVFNATNVAVLWYARLHP